MKPQSFRELGQGVRRYDQGTGECAECGMHARLYLYRYPGMLNYRIPPRFKEPAFCSKQCANTYHV